MKLEEYEAILRTGTPSERARAVAEAGADKELTDEEFHELTALLKGAVRPRNRKMNPAEAQLWAAVSLANCHMKKSFDEASLAIGMLPGYLQEDAINAFSHTMGEMRSRLARMMAETGEP